MKLSLFLATVTMAAGCTRPPTPPPALLPFSWRVLLSGCAEELPDGGCEVDPGPLRIAVYSPQTLPPHVWLDGKPQSPHIDFVEGVHRIELQLPQAPAVIQLEVDDSEGSHLWRRTLVASSTPAPIREAKALRTRNALDQADAVLEPFLHSSNLDDRIRALSVKARVHWSRGQWDEAIALYRQTIPSHRDAGRLASAADDTQALAFTLSYIKVNPQAAQELLEASQWLASTSHRGAWFLVRSQVATRRFQSRLALQLLEEAHLDAKRYGSSSDLEDAQSSLMLELGYEGRWTEALALAKEVHARFLIPEELKDKPCASWLVTAHQLAMIRWAARDQSPELVAQFPDPRPNIAGVAAQIDACSHPEAKPLYYETLAVMNLSTHEPEQARANLARLGPYRVLPETTMWSLLMEATAFEQLGRSKDALALYLRIGKLAREWEIEDFYGVSARGSAQQYRKLGNTAAALAAYEEVSREAQSLVRRMPLTQGRLSYLRETERAALEHIELLVSMGRPAEALDRFRQLRARMLASLRLMESWENAPAELATRWSAFADQYRRLREEIDELAKSEWKRSAQSREPSRLERKRKLHALQEMVDEAFEVLPGQSPPSLKGPGPSELFLAWIPNGAAWIAIAQDETGTQAQSVASFDPSLDSLELGHRLLDPFSERLERAQKIRLFVHGGLKQVDFHALSWRGKPLIAHAEVEYAIDLPKGAGAGVAANQIVIVGDPLEDLKNAAEEARFVGGRFSSATMLVGAAATAPRLAQLLPNARLLHYAGHSTRVGPDFFEAMLPLAGDSRLSATDILFLSHAPEVVVLSACDASQSEGQGAAEGIGLAQAFVAVGSRQVIAPSRKVDDALALALSKRLYAGDLLANPSRALREAQRSLIDESPQLDWAAFRVIAR
jgi:tetratricopeptide (TPR) repeat protein